MLDRPRIPLSLISNRRLARSCYLLTYAKIWPNFFSNNLQFGTDSSSPDKKSNIPVSVVNLCELVRHANYDFQRIISLWKMRIIKFLMFLLRVSDPNFKFSCDARFGRGRKRRRCFSLVHKHLPWKNNYTINKKNVSNKIKISRLKCWNFLYMVIHCPIYCSVENIPVRILLPLFN